VAGWARRLDVDAADRIGKWSGHDVAGEAAVDESALVSYLRSRHPDWDAARVQRVVDARLRDDRD
jgi:hypothetical protein